MQMRNIGVIAHIDAGKTTLTERILFYTRKIHRMGEVHEGTATMDYLPEEQERGITITSACTTCVWKDTAINVIDTPGHVDFTIEVERSLRVLDGAVGVFCAVSGVEPQSETVWRQSERFGVPKLVFINKLDRPGADYTATLEAVASRLGGNPVPLVIPCGEEESFRGIIDLISMERLEFDEDSQGEDIQVFPLTDEERAAAEPWRERMLETLAEADEIFLEIYLGGTVTGSAVRAAVRRATIARAIHPVFAGSALRNSGVQPLLDGICDYLPQPSEAAEVTAVCGDGTQIVLSTAADEPFVGLVFKVVLDGGRKLAFVRIYAGTLCEGEVCRNARTGERERISRLYRLHADRREQLDAASAGDIVAVVGLRGVITGDTVEAPGQDVQLESIDGHAPVIALALEPRNADEGKALDEALARFTVEDPTLRVDHDEASGHRIVSGMGELHLDVVLERIRREYAIDPRVGRPQVLKRETVVREAEAEALFERELGTQLHHGAVSLRIRPVSRGAGQTVLWAEALEQAQVPIPQAFKDAVWQGVCDALLCDPVTGYPVQDVEITITALERKEGLSTAPGFQMAAGLAIRNVLEAAQPLVLEPIMNVEITVPESSLGSALSLFGAQGGKVESMEEWSGQKRVQGLAPMSRLFGFSTALRSATQGRAGLVLRFERFDSL